MITLKKFSFGKKKKNTSDSALAKKSSGLKFKFPSKLLVFFSNGSHLYGTVASCGTTGLVSLDEAAVSTASVPEEAVAEIVAALGEAGRKVPKAAILLTPSVVSDFIYLPVNPRKKRKSAQMSEMVRWELEETFAHQGDLWSLGAILQGRGIISQAQRQQVEAAGNHVEKPFSEVEDVLGTEEPEELEESSAIFQGAGGGFVNFVTPEELENTLNLQEFLSGMDDDLLTACAPLHRTGEEGQFLWYGVGIGDGICNGWVAACRHSGLTLKALYPIFGTAIPFFCNIKTEQWLYIDIQQEQYGIYTGLGARPATVTFKEIRHGQPEPAVIADEAIAQLQGESRCCFINAPAELLPRLVAALEGPMEERGGVVEVCGGAKGAEAIENETCPWRVLAAMEGAAAHSFGLAEKSQLVAVRTREKQASWWQDRDAVIWFSLLMLLVSAIAGYFYLSGEARKYELELAKKDVEYGKRLKMKTQMEQTASEIQVLQKRLVDTEMRLAKQEHYRDILNNVIRKRQQLVPGVLTAVSRAMNDKVMVDLLEEDKARNGFFIRGWALEDTAGQVFAGRLNEELRGWRYKVDGMQIDRDKGALGVEGFQLKIRVSRMIEKKGEKTDWKGGHNG